MTNQNIPLSIPDIGDEEIDAVARVIRRRWLTMGEETESFEREFSEIIDVDYAVAVSNCTVALHLALLALGLKTGDEVIVPSLSFAATANAVLYCGAVPVFADICGEHNLNIDPEDVVSKVTSKTRGVIPVHHSGYAADMDGLRSICSSENLFLLEDAAQAAGASGLSGRCGAMGDAGCFSLYSTKNITTGEGGVVTTNDEKIAEKVRSLRSHAMTASVADRDSGKKFGYDVVDLGFNYRMDEMRAAIGRVQLGKLYSGNKRRRELTSRYHRLLGAETSFKLPFSEEYGEASCHLLPVLLPHGMDRIATAEYMRSKGIQTSVHYRPIHLLSYYRNSLGTCEGMLPRTEDISARELSLPLYSTMSDSQVDLVCETLIEACTSIRT